MRRDASKLSARLGWTGLAAWAAVGLALEAAHGWKIAAYVDDALARELLRLAHAHGVGLSVVLILYGVSAAPRLASELALHLARALAAAAALLPAGFALGAIAHPEGDPGAGIVLAPIGAAVLLYALVRTAFALWRAD